MTRQEQAEDPHVEQDRQQDDPEPAPHVWLLVVVVLDDDVRFPEGQAVTVLAHTPDESKSHSVLDILPVSVGAVIRRITADDDLLGEMLEGRS